MSRTAIKLDEWEQALADAMGRRGDDVPKGWITIPDFALKIGKGRATADRKMRMLVEAGGAERRVFRILVGSGKHLWPVPHYRLKRNGSRAAA